MPYSCYTTLMFFNVFYLVLSLIRQIFLDEEIIMLFTSGQIVLNVLTSNANVNTPIEIVNQNDSLKKTLDVKQQII